MRSWSKPVQVRLVTKSLAKFTRRWTKSCIAGMSAMHLVTIEGQLVNAVERTKVNPPGKTATFLTGIDLPTWHHYPLEGAGLVDSHREEKSAR
jgi:hypothetical protein